MATRESFLRLPAPPIQCPGRRTWVTIAWVKVVGGRAESSLLGPPGDVAALTGRLDRIRMVVLAHERDRLGAGDAVEDGEAGQRGAGAPSSAGAGDLHSFGRGTLPGFGQSGQHGGFIGGQAEVRPPEPAGFPGDGWRSATEQVDAEGRPGPVGQRLAEAAASYQPARRQAQDARCRTVPRFTHSRIVYMWPLDRRAGAGHCGRLVGRGAAAETSRRSSSAVYTAIRQNGSHGWPLGKLHSH
jgi:hypothetical protein